MCSMGVCGLLGGLLSVACGMFRYVFYGCVFYGELYNIVYYNIIDYRILYREGEGDGERARERERERERDRESRGASADYGGILARNGPTKTVEKHAVAKKSSRKALLFLMKNKTGKGFKEEIHGVRIPHDPTACKQVEELLQMLKNM